jgi:hypothetical protein
VILFVDNDVILKLTACDLFWEAIACLGFKDSDVRVLDTAKYKFRSLSRKTKNKKSKENYSEEVCERAITIVEKLTTVSTDNNNPIISIKSDGLDVGELTLIGEAILAPSFYLASGDKRCLRAMTKCSDLDNVRNSLNRRLICFEQLIAKLIAVKGFEMVKERVLPNKDCDGVLSAVFGSGDRSTEANVSAALDGYITALDQECPNLLHIDI